MNLGNMLQSLKPKEEREWDEEFDEATNKKKSEIEEQIKSVVDNSVEEKQGKWNKAMQKFRDDDTEGFEKALKDIEAFITGEVSQEIGEIYETHREETKDIIREEMKEKVETINNELERLEEKVDSERYDRKERLEEVSNRLNDFQDKMESHKEGLNGRMDGIREDLNDASDLADWNKNRIDTESEI